MRDGENGFKGMQTDHQLNGQYTQCDAGSQCGRCIFAEKEVREGRRVVQQPQNMPIQFFEKKKPPSCNQDMVTSR